MRYERHARLGIVAHAVVILLAGVSSLLLSVEEIVVVAAGGALPATLLGATSPDLDHPCSIPHRRVRLLTTALVTGATAFVLHARSSALISLVAHSPLALPPTFLAGELAVVVVGAAATATYLYVPSLLAKPAHRGLFHQLPTGIVAATVLYGGCVFTLVSTGGPAPFVVSGVLAGAFVAGFLSHLAADRLLSRRQTYLGQTLDDRL